MSGFEAALRLLPLTLGWHVALSAAALLAGVALSLPLALLAVGRPKWRWPILTIAGAIQTIPSLALLALFYPVLVALSAAAKAAFGVGFPALGFLPSFLALTLYSMLPMLRNGVAAFTGLDAAVLEAARGVGMTPRQSFIQIEAPLAAPVVMAGVRTAAVWTVGAATLATTVGQTSLGDYIFSGLQLEDWSLVLFGCAATALLALITDQLLGTLQAGFERRDRGRLWFGGLGLALGVALAVGTLAMGGQAKTHVVGAKNFSEQYILADLISQRIAKAGGEARTRVDLGSTVAFKALAANEIDVYVDYSGTLWSNVLGRRDIPPRAELLRQLAAELKRRYRVDLAGPLGFENAYALAMRRADAERLGIRTLADLAAHARRLKLGSDLEFLSRPEWTALRSAYGLDFQATRRFQPTFMYRAIADRSVDVISAFSSDGRIATLDLVVLSDPKAAAPPYDAVVLIAPARARDPVLRRAVQPLIGHIGIEAMRRANQSADRDTDKLSPGQAALNLAREAGLN